ncbi:MAG: SpoIIE family protein phosphatase [Prevotella sp.]|nr:SpoIIE family protein phosphatase [Prevotella sp.]
MESTKPKVKILSVDDEAPLELLMRQYFRRKIRSGEYEFFFAHNGLEALTLMLENPDIEIILSDINMPEMDGLTLLAKINEMRNPALRVIMVSAYGDMKNIRHAMNNGAFDFTTKPIDMDDLAQTIEKAREQIAYVHQSQKEHTQLESLKKDLTVAAEIQQYILPRIFPPFPEDAERMDIAASMQAAKDIGGDFYDFFRLDDEHIALVIADVCGKGIPAALFMAMSRTLIRSKGMQVMGAAECLTEANKLLVSYSVDKMFVTVFYAVYNINTGQVTYCNAGHNPPLVLREDGSVEELPVTRDVVLGIINGFSFHEGSMQLNRGDALFMFTDGVNEATDSEQQEFGMERLTATLKSGKGESCQQMIDGVKASMAAFVGNAEQSDDITMLALKRT